MKYLATALLVLFCSMSTAAEIGETYRAKVDLKICPDLPLGNTIESCDICKMVGEDSKFDIIDKRENYYLIEFSTLYKYKKLNPEYVDGSNQDYYINTDSEVAKGRAYYLPVKYYDDLPADKLLDKSVSGVVSGPLVVPFKYRSNDKSISGEASIGYYIGWGIDIYATGVGFTPILSAGLTQITVATPDGQGGVNEDTKTGLTWATGFLFANWDGVNFGVIYGQDRIGDASWAHEGEGWLSVSVGWDL